MTIKNRRSLLVLFLLFSKNLRADQITELDAMTIYSGKEVAEEIANSTQLA